MPLGADPLPTFTTARLGLRPRSLADLDECLAMDRDPLVTKFIHGPWAIRSPTKPLSKPASATPIRPAWDTGPFSRQLSSSAGFS